MGKNARQRIGVALAAAALMVNYSPVVRTAGIGRAGEEASAVQTVLPVHERLLIPGGQAVGVALRTQGVLVVARSTREGTRTPLRVGDVILTVQGQAVTSAGELSARVGASQTDTVALGILRRGREMTLEASVPTDGADGRRRLGVWVRDSTAGVGTLSYVDPVTHTYGALGHAIVDGDTGDMVTVREGAILHAEVVGVTRGESGHAGELKGSFLKENEQIGTLVLNSAYGIYGVMDRPSPCALYPQGLPAGSRSDVHPGEATILATVDGRGTQEYSVEILRCFDQSEPSQKGMILRVTDERLLEKTGGIVQGMSGSPIIQDGKLVGAVTHVVLSDATQGYGMYIEWMLEQSDRISAGDTAQAA